MVSRARQLGCPNTNTSTWVSCKSVSICKGGSSLISVMISYLEESNFLICISHCTFFPFGLTMFTEDCYTLFRSLFCSSCAVPFRCLHPCSLCALTRGILQLSHLWCSWHHILELEVLMAMLEGLILACQHSFIPKLWWYLEPNGFPKPC